MLKPKIRIGHVGTLHDHSLGKLNCVGKYPDIFKVIGIVEENPRATQAAGNGVSVFPVFFYVRGGTP